MEPTGTIDAAELRARLAEMAQRARDEMTPAGLRERIAAALRARHGANASVDLGPAPDGFIGRDAVAFVMGGYVAVRADDDGAALRGLASFVGLNADGTDPRAEVARLRALLEVAQTSLAAATSGRRVTVVDEIERLQRERDEARESALDRADDFDRLVIRVWRAATGDTHEGPASVEALVAAVVRLTNTIESVTGQICDMTTRHDSLRAIIEGRTVAPTDAEIVAHWRAGGTWVVEGVIVLRDVEAVRAHRDQASWAAVTWLPLDRSRRPCAWPVVEVSR